MGDFSIECGQALWNSYAGGLAVFLLLYPIGIPLVYFLRLQKLKSSLRNPLTQLELGFLYLAYSEPFWWFECLDMLFKLIMTSVVVFLPNQMELTAGLIITTLYLIWMLLFNP